MLSDTMTFPISVAPSHSHAFTRRELTLPQLEEFLSTFQPVEAKSRAPMWSPVIFAPGSKSRDAVLSGGHMLVFDIDQPTLPPILDSLPFLWYAHETYSRGWRVIFPVSRDIRIDEWASHHKPWSDALGVGVERDITRGYYTPVAPPNAAKTFRKSASSVIYDVDNPPVPHSAVPSTAVALRNFEPGHSVWPQISVPGSTIVIPEGQRANTCYSTMFAAALRNIPFEQAWALLVPHLEGHEDASWLAQAKPHGERGYASGLAMRDSEAQRREALLSSLDKASGTTNVDSLLQRDEKTGRPISNLFNLEIIINSPPIAPIRLNTITNTVSHPKKSPLNVPGDGAVHALRVYCEVKHKFRPSAQDAKSAISSASERNAYSPVVDYLKSLKWDGTARISDLLLTVAGAQGHDGYIRAATRKFFVAAVQRAINPGCKVDTMLILQGEQGAKKSQLIAALGREWYSAMHLDAASKDTILYMHSAWIVEIDELAHRRKDVEAQKALLSRASDLIRKPYAAVTENLPRSCILVGTTNETDILSDPTGARRFWPISVNGTIDIDYVKRNRDQLWAEAYQAALAGEAWWVDGDETALFSAEAVYYEEPSSVDDMMGNIRAWMLQKKPEDRPKMFPFKQLLDEIWYGKDLSMLERNACGRALTKLGFKKWRSNQTTEGYRPMMYISPEILLCAELDAERPVILPEKINVKSKSKPN